MTASEPVDLPATHPGPGESAYDFGRRLAATHPMPADVEQRLQRLLRPQPETTRRAS